MKQRRGKEEGGRKMRERSKDRKEEGGREKRERKEEKER